MGNALLLFNISRPQRLIEPSSVAQMESRTPAENSRFVCLLAENETGRIFNLNHVRGPLSKAAALQERLLLRGRAKVGFEKLSAVQS
jgi:hypothetical protein